MVEAPGGYAFHLFDGVHGTQKGKQLTATWPYVHVSLCDMYRHVLEVCRGYIASQVYLIEVLGAYIIFFLLNTVLYTL